MVIHNAESLHPVYFALLAFALNLPPSNTNSKVLKTNEPLS